VFLIKIKMWIVQLKVVPVNLPIVPPLSHQQLAVQLPVA
jgi:hypothetical protein